MSSEPVRQVSEIQDKGVRKTAAESDPRDSSGNPLDVQRIKQTMLTKQEILDHYHQNIKENMNVTYSKMRIPTLQVEIGHLKGILARHGGTNGT